LPSGAAQLHAAGWPALADSNSRRLGAKLIAQKNCVKEEAKTAGYMQAW